MDWNFHHPHYHSQASHKQQQHLCVFHFHQQPKDHWDQYFLVTLKWLGIVEAKNKITKLTNSFDKNKFKARKKNQA